MRGFTIIELVVALVLVSVLAVALWPRSPATEALTIQARAEQLASDIRYVQALSMTRGQRFCMVMTNANYEIRTTVGNACTAVQEPHPAGLTQPVPVCNSACMGFSNFAGTLLFNGLGVPYTDATTVLGSTASITITDGGNSRTVTVTPTTGRVIVQ